MILSGYQNDCSFTKDDLIGLLEQEKVIKLDITRANLLIAHYESGRRTSKEVLALWRKHEKLRTIGGRYAVLVSLFAFKPTPARKAKDDDEHHRARCGTGTGAFTPQKRDAEKIKCTILVKID